MKYMDRRSFLKTSALASASLSLLPMLGCKSTGVHARVRGANEDIRIAVVGFNGRGRSHIDGFRNLKGVRVVALCDVDQTVLDKGVKEFKDRGENVTGYQDIRKLLENPDIDAVSLATPNHWHALGTIWAAQAGKDVYAEKPASHNIWEGRQAVEAARKYGRIVQTGSQSRSAPGLQEAIAWIRAGNHGKIIRARGLCYKRRASIGKADQPLVVPSSIDFDLWCGPAPKEPVMRKRLHYDWHWVWPSGNGDLGNQGVHQMDIGRWVLGENELAPSSFSIGGRLGYDDDGTTPNTQIVVHAYAKAPLIFEVRGLPTSCTSDQMDKYHGAGIGVVVDCEGGRVVIPSYHSAIVFDKEGKEIKKFDEDGDHFANFIKAVRSRKHTDLNADINDGHLSAALCHTANISYRLGRKLSPDQIREATRNNSEMAEALGRMEEHLAANQVDVKKTPATLGKVLKVDGKKEMFIGDPEASQMLTREYRKPFVVPKKV
ncbi:MAG: Gfo/Idh/MocA family oxidoreductase [Verrucomicrobia bacterium]|nr:Gfo/Idh/MocA family oxidoreductase [Verrucomicrobiota bacterium]